MRCHWISGLGDTPFPAYGSACQGWNRSEVGNGVRNGRVWAGLLGVEKTTIERVELDEEQGLLITHVRPVRWQRGRCGVCQRRGEYGLRVGGVGA